MPCGDAGSIKSAIGRYDLQLHFSDHASISIVGEFVVTSPGGERAAFDQPIPAAAILAERLSSGVVEAVVAEPGVVSLRFSDGYGLYIPDSSDRYESYTINLEGRLIIV